MQGITNFISSARTAFTQGMHSLTKGATMAEIFSKTVLNPIVVVGVPAIATTAVYVCINRQARAPKPQDSVDPKVAVWNFQQKIESVEEGMGVDLETEVAAEYSIGIDNKWKKLVTKPLNGKHVVQLTAEQLKGKSRIEFKMFWTDAQIWEPVAKNFEINIQKA